MGLGHAFEVLNGIEAYTWKIKLIAVSHHHVVTKNNEYLSWFNSRVTLSQSCHTQLYSCKICWRYIYYSYYTRPNMKSLGGLSPMFHFKIDDSWRSTCDRRNGVLLPCQYRKDRPRFWCGLKTGLKPSAYWVRCDMLVAVSVITVYGASTLKKKVQV